MSSLLHRTAVFSARHRKLVIGVWLALLVGLGLVSHAAGTKYTSTVVVPGSDSASATATMSASFSPQLADSSPIVYHVDTGTLAQHKRGVDASLKALSASPKVAQVGRLTTARNGRTAYATIVPSEALGDMTVDQAQRILDTAAKPAGGVGGEAESDQQGEPDADDQRAVAGAEHRDAVQGR